MKTAVYDLGAEGPGFESLGPTNPISPLRALADSRNSFSAHPRSPSILRNHAIPSKQARARCIDISVSGKPVINRKSVILSKALRSFTARGAVEGPAVGS
jgi:hypothetical protein